MGIEIERKFRLKDDSWKANAMGKYYHQGYLSNDLERIVRVRIAGNKAFLTIKGKNIGNRRPEFEYAIPMLDATEMLENLCTKPNIEKHRYRVEFKGFIWEIDEFHGENKGLVVAEIELDAENTGFDLPPWIGEEVSGDPKYFNSNLASFPFSKW